VDDEDIRETGQRPDVLLTLPDGSRIAYEIQLAYQSQEEWQVRHNKYAGAGIRDVWLFGGRHYDRPPRGPHAPGEVTVHPVFEAVLATWHPLLLIDPTAETVALGSGDTVQALLTAAGYRPPLDLPMVADAGGRVSLMPQRTSHGIIDLPGLREMIQQARADHPGWVKSLRLQDESEERRLAERTQRNQQLEKEFAERARQAELAEQARHEKERAVRELFDQRTRAWAPDREALEQVLGALPDVVDQSPSLRELSLTAAAPAQWRWRVLRALTENAGFTVDHRTLISLIPLRRNIPPSDAQAMVRDYLCDLRKEGWVWFWGDRGPRHGEAVRVEVKLGQSPRVTPAAALRVVGRVRVAGPSPRGNGYMTLVGGLSDPVHLSRAVGPASFDRAWDEARAEKPERARWALLAAAVDSGIAVRAPTPEPAPDLAVVHEAFPFASRWCAQREWPTWTSLPPHLHEAARLTAYLACVVVERGPVDTLRLGTCSVQDALEIREALRRSGYIVFDQDIWQSTYGGVL
jgi:hypothetical protein